MIEHVKNTSKVISKGKAALASAAAAATAVDRPSKCALSRHEQVHSSTFDVARMAIVFTPFTAAVWSEREIAEFELVIAAACPGVFASM